MSATTQKTALFILAAVRTSNPTKVEGNKTKKERCEGRDRETEDAA
jgi:hypothetical protein